MRLQLSSVKPNIKEGFSLLKHISPFCLCDVCSCPVGQSKSRMETLSPSHYRMIFKIALKKVGFKEGVICGPF